MRGRWLVGVCAVVLGTACAPAAPAAPPDPPAVRLDAVALPGGEPQALAVAGDALLVGVRGAGPGLLRRAADGTTTEVPTRSSTPYGATASWYALTSDGTRILAV